MSGRELQRGLLLTWSVFWRQGLHHCLSFTPSTSPHPHVFPWQYVLSYFFLILGEVRAPNVCAVYSASASELCSLWWCVWWTYNSTIRIYTHCDCVCSDVVCVLILRLICWGWTKPDSRRVLMTRNRTLSPHNLCREPCLQCARASTQTWRRRRSKRRDSRFVFAVRASRLW